LADEAKAVQPRKVGPIPLADGAKLSLDQLPVEVKGSK
jgi:hypothetical protein